MNRIHRREFLSRTSLAAAAISLGDLNAAREQTRAKSEISIFSKHLQWLDFDAMAHTAAEIGFDGIDLTVRPGGHVAPERATQLLPEAVAAARKAGIKVTMLTTAITDPDDPATEAILRTAAGLGIRHYRMGYYRYDKSKSIEATLAEAKAKLRNLVSMNKQFSIRGGYQNHAGNGYVGASIWDLWYAIRDLDTKGIGFQFDIRHATVEGGNSWPTDLRLIAPMIGTVVAKDFRWTEQDGKWKTLNCPLGQGMVDFKTYLRMLQSLGVAVPVTLHMEFPIGGAEHGAREISVPKKAVISAMRDELTTLSGYLAGAGL
jgi:sugar phosphate isomerase/epimerase